MGLIDSTLQGIRLAGSNLGEYLSNPATLKGIGKRVALDTALGTTAAQVVPRVLGQQPAAGVGRTAFNVGLHSALSTPISGGLQAMGVPEWAAQTTGQIAGGAGAQVISQSITHEVNQQPNTHYAELMQLQQLEAAQENQRVQNQIALAYARNYHAPSQIIHRNPSQDLATVHAILNPKVGY